MRFLALLFLSLPIYAQFTVSGTIKDEANGETLIGVNIYAKEQKTGVSTNVYGFYSLSLPAGTHTLIVSYVGYHSLEKVINVKEDQTLNIELKDKGTILQEVVIQAEKEDANVKSVSMSVNKVEMRTIKKMPALLGEVDLVRSILYLPGVSSVGEGSSGFNVRGGAIDQNLVLLDEAPVYNSSHLMGFFSIFNPDVVKDVKLIKGGVPAQYGGRISSILDVRMKEGNNKKTEFTGGIGTIFSRLALEGPLKKNKGSYIVALRRSYIDILAKPFLKDDLKDVKFYFYDFTAKANYQLDDKNTLYLSGYFGRDLFGADFGFDWGNATTTLRWNHVFNRKLFLNTTLFYSMYKYSLDSDLKNTNKEDVFRWNSDILNYSIKPDFTWYLNSKNTISFGGQSILYHFNPGSALIVSSSEGKDIGIAKKKALESTLYLGNEMKISDNLTINAGIRYSDYRYFGSPQAYVFDENGTPGERKSVLDTLHYSGNELIQRYGNWEPRLSANLSLGPRTSLKIGYNHLAQYIHLLSNTTASSPLDVWTPSTNNIKPQISDQIALGLFMNFKDNMYESSVEVYYKTLQNQIDYIRNADLLLNPLVEGDLMYGKGRAYGAEFFVKKNKGNLNGWISYTLSRTERKVNGLNNNDWFLSRIDKLHNLSVVAIYDISKRWNMGATFTYMTGTPASFPTTKYIWQGIAVPHNYYDERNIYRIPASHRLDLSATLKNKHALFKKGESEWVFSIYNVYNRRNPFSVYVRQNPDDPSKTEAVRYSVFASILPSITYNFKF
ncbi:TonB-dependent receptor [Leadbetterella byssophila DSM 17132]|uniref:TonB-dependent receptor n=1 Tax=Leadbetterella byssophila (strain DSM 17132 / JCM 16389 / KACC 11308 / NBRC 106382 / 4M15) TaxID=649349 RepID=E4RQV3_LEAB4|nr:TonB-dependent receptor [Leadbetterella byssophila]ADQ18396.1 TonB-dependent receptor [Leadbetterella byssophila DSM 17132]